MPRLFVLALLIAVGAATPAAAAPLAQRLVRNVDGVTVEYSPGDEAYADELVHRLGEVRSSPVAATPTAGQLEKLDTQRTSYMAAVSSTLALPAPTAEMTLFWTNFLALFRATERLADPLTAARHYQLWRRPELIERLRAGERIPGFSLDGPTGLKFSLDFKGDDPVDLEEYWRTRPLPIAVGTGAPPAEDIAAGIQKLRGLAGVSRANSVSDRPFVLLHEITEAGVIWHYIGSPDRRWFCDGVANYVAWMTLRDRLGAAEAKKIYDLEAELKKYHAVAGTMDLEKWPAAENQGKENYREDLNTANYAFATEVIARVCAKHGETLLPRWFAEIGKTPRAKTTMQTVYRAYTKVTGEDLRAYLPQPAAR